MSHLEGCVLHFVFFWVTSLIRSCSRVLFYDKVKAFFLSWVFNVIVNSIGSDKNAMVSFCLFYSLVIDLFCCGCNYCYIALFVWQNVAPGNVNQCGMVSSQGWRYFCIILCNWDEKIVFHIVLQKVICPFDRWCKIFW